MNNYDPLTKARKWLTTSKSITDTGKYFADAKVVKELNDDIEHGDNFVGTDIEWDALSTAEKIKYKTADIIIDSGLAGALKFSSDEPFNLSMPVFKCNGTLEYSIDNGETWSTWSGSQLSGNVSQPIYLRGTGNTRMTGIDIDAGFRFTGKYCIGNIETLLDYQTVLDDQHPTMDTFCFYDLFYRYCPSLVIPPKLPATTLVNYCYNHMFTECTSLKVLPKLPATILANSCYEGMFVGCSSLKLSTTQDSTYKYGYRIPTVGTGTIDSSSSALSGMFSDTGGTFTGTPTINTTYYTDHEPVG